MSLAAKLRLGPEILLAYCRAWWGMRREELPRVVERIRAEHTNRKSPPSMEERRSIAGATMGLLAVLPTDSRCLVRSLTYLSLLERRGVSATLVIGVRTKPDFLAHAWVESGDEALLPSGDGEFAPLTKF